MDEKLKELFFKLLEESENPLLEGKKIRSLILEYIKDEI